MGQYVYFSEEQKLRADDVDLEDFLRQQGETLIRSGHDLRLKSDHSVTIRGNEWFDHATQKGGHPVSFVQRHYGLSYPEAMSLLLGGEQGRSYGRARDIVVEEPKPFALPPANDNMRRTFAYLIKQRHIDPDVISTFAKDHVLYEDKPYHNAVFVGRDENGMARHAHKRSTNSYGRTFRMNIEGSDPRYSFHHIGRDGSLFVFEAPIDLMSFATMFPYDWQDHSYVACCGTSFQPVGWMLGQAQINSVFLCLDNDKAGQEACERMEEELRSFGIGGERLIPKRKDWNDDLVALCEQQQEQEATPCQTMCGI